MSSNENLRYKGYLEVVELVSKIILIIVFSQKLWARQDQLFSIILNYFLRYKGYLEVVELVMESAAGCEKLPRMDMDESCE